MPLSRPITRAAVAASLALGLLAGSRTASAQQPATTLNGPSRFVSTNPFLPLFGYFSGEYEQRIKDNVAFAIAGSHVKLDDRYTNIDAKLRLYPNDKALEGFGVAASLGMSWIKRVDNINFCFDAICENNEFKTFSSPSFAIELGYQWLLGRTKSTAITAGFGAKRYLGGTRAQFDEVERVVPTGRLSIGYGF